jgi:predicted nucleotidyltransferase component of viral defense system
MTVPHRYATSTALHDAIKVRAAAEAKVGHRDINQIRRHFAYDRFLTRIFLDPESTWVLKGGTGLLVRVPQRARHTQGIDLYRHGEIERAHTELAAATNRDLGDFFSFDIEQTGVPDHAPGIRPIDIDGLPTTNYRIYPVVDHLAEKLVAMTSMFAGNRPSTRFRDLVDMVLIAQTQTNNAEALRTAVESEQLHRNHTLPERLEIAVALYRPVFDDSTVGTWEPSTMEWI